jgi:hypothetical protein
LKKTLCLILVLFATGTIFGQDTLPKFTLVERGGRVIISWTNPFTNVVQLNVQRSYDSLKYFTTIFSPTSPGLPQNGYSDTRKPVKRIFYRIFYVLEGGSYFFTRVKRADGTESGAVQDFNRAAEVRKSRDNTPDYSNVVPGDTRVITVKIKDTLLGQLSINSFRNFKDSILRTTQDTLYSINDTLVGLSRYVAKEEFRTSSYVYLNRDGYINISLPSINQKKYNIKFFEENGTSLFEIKNVKESPLIIDKASFVHAGWFLFELYEDDKLKEKNRFYLPKDF